MSKMSDGEAMRQEEYFKLLDELADLTRRKRAGYSPGADPYRNFRGSEAFGVSPVIGILIRVQDKIARAASLLADPDNDMVGETIEETLIDAGNYPLLAVAMMRADRKKAETGIIQSRNC